MIANVTLDYTEWAPPLTADAVKRDLDTYWIMHLRHPSKIVMWVHQWEWIAKKERPKYIVEDAEFCTDRIYATLRPAESSDGGTIFGVRVEVRDPEAHGS